MSAKPKSSHEPAPAGLAGFYSQTSDYWTAYLKGRAPLPNSIFQRIFDYHTCHGGQFHTVHEAGAAAAIHSLRIGAPFTKVIVSDSSEDNIAAARARLSGAKEAKYELHVTKLEDSGAVLPPASVDMVFCATMLHFTDLPRSFEAIAHQLKPGGTFAALFTGFMEMEDARLHAAFIRRLQLWAPLMLEKMGGEEAVMPQFVTIACMYENVELPATIFEAQSERIFINGTDTGAPGGTMYADTMPPDYRERWPAVSGIGAEEIVIRVDDAELYFEKDLSALPYHLNTFPPAKVEGWVEESMRELGEIVGDGKIRGRWPVNLILATRK
ncbi:hypothetical protein BDY17DRAFT_322534 [Neohortaea acidophila]|uniref:Methyltransferase type 11 domain-containing protein n=1 Tax=Neohortaea acidophila TaxID=245834 RepID=A0A6A6Q0A8_9PEZI|nr:uncharacterized protein BDY17DRAFT_322534 [Neohortaea acidophila]KAF2485712.1 hypothetical protein BDY17DRAFT_322534 [Neohortaea acidophila]